MNTVTVDNHHETVARRRLLFLASLRPRRPLAWVSGCLPFRGLFYSRRVSPRASHDGTCRSVFIPCPSPRRAQELVDDRGRGELGGCRCRCRGDRGGGSERHARSRPWEPRGRRGGCWSRNGGCWRNGAGVSPRGRGVRAHGATRGGAHAEGLALLGVIAGLALDARHDHVRGVKLEGGPLLRWGSLVVEAHSPALLRPVLLRARGELELRPLELTPRIRGVVLRVIRSRFLCARHGGDAKWPRGCPGGESRSFFTARRPDQQVDFRLLVPARPPVLTKRSRHFEHSQVPHVRFGVRFLPGSRVTIRRVWRPLDSSSVSSSTPIR